jgi:hypothetical protein
MENRKHKAKMSPGRIISDIAKKRLGHNKKEVQVQAEAKSEA